MPASGSAVHGPDPIGTTARLRQRAEAMTGTAALPRHEDGEPLFDEPWHGRVFAMALETVHGLDLDWEDFRGRLIASIAVDSERSYYESWLTALDELVTEHGLTTTAAVDDHRQRAASYRASEQDTDDLEVFPISAAESTLHDVLHELFGRWWREITFGPIIQGAAYELALPQEPRLSMLDGYLTIAVGPSHLHVCIGVQRGLGGRPVSPELARRRRCAHAELQRLWVDGAPRTWMFRMYNGDGEQQLTVLLPNPFLDDQQQVLDAPDWSRLELWDRLRHQHLDLPPDPVDRLGTTFVHA